MTNVKKQWFDVLDSKTEKENGNGFYYNVEARFSDHPVINVEKSRVARHSVYDYSIVLHTRVKRVAGDAKAQPNMSAQPLRFDKGAAMGGDDFDKAKLAIMRCWDAWQHYCKWREAPVTVAEKMAMEQISRAPLSAIGTVRVDKGGVLVDARRAGDETDDDADDEGDDAGHLMAAAEKAVAPARQAARARAKKPRAAA